MSPEADPTQLSRQVWQAVSDYAFRSIAGRDLNPEHSRIENLRPVFSIDEDECHYGRQIWCFEAVGIHRSGRHHVVYGMMEFSIQYGLLELSHSAIFQSDADREHSFSQWVHPEYEDRSDFVSTRLWVWAAWASVAILTGGWLAALCRYMFAVPAEFIR